MKSIGYNPAVEISLAEDELISDVMTEHVMAFTFGQPEKYEALLASAAVKTLFARGALFFLVSEPVQ